METPGTPGMQPPPPPMPDSAAAPLKQGDTLGGRFVVDESLGAGPVGGTWQAVDQKSGRRIVLLVFEPALLEDRAVTEPLRAAIKQATGLAHKNIAGTFGMGKQGEHRYVAREFVDGRTLTTLLEKKVEAGKRFSLKGAYNLVAHVCNALQAARETLPHGLLRPSAIRVNRQGRVKLSGFGMGDLRPAVMKAASRLSEWDRPFFTGEPDAARSDLRGLGLLVVTLLTGRPAVPDADLSEVLMGMPDGLVDLVAGALDPNRPGAVDSPRAFKVGLQAATAGARAEADSASPEVAPPPPPTAEEVMASAPPPPTARGPAIVPGAAPAARDVPDDGTLQRWLVRKDDTDFGPFTHKEVVEQLFGEEIDAETELYDIETDRRLTLSEFSAFEDDLVSWIHEKAKREKVRAEAAAKAKARRRNRLLLTFVGGPLVAIAAGVGGWVWYQSTLPSPERAYVPDLLTRIDGTLPAVTLPEEAPETLAEKKARQKAEADARATKRARAEARKVAREAKLAAQSELSVGGGTGKRFNGGAFNRLISKRSGRLTKCLEAEARRDPNLRQVTVKMTVIPRGDVINVSLKGGTSRGNSCVRSALSGLKVPAFDGTNRKVALPFQVR